jgi:hypothetical protein
LRYSVEKVAAYWTPFSELKFIIHDPRNIYQYKHYIETSIVL